MTWTNLIDDVSACRRCVFPQGLLRQSDRIYVMDNHQAALWCWLQRVDSTDTYNILHIDRHYDSTDLVDFVAPALNGRLIHDLSLSDYLSIDQKFGSECVAPVFRYDNYFPTLLHYYPTFVGCIYTATHECGTRLVYENQLSVRPDELPVNVDFWMTGNGSDAKRPWIVNVDIDYFFYPDTNQDSRELFSTAYVEELFTHIKTHIDSGDIQVITIATSPGNTGTEAKANKFCEKVCSLLGCPINLTN